MRLRKTTESFQILKKKKLPSTLRASFQPSPQHPSPMSTHLNTLKLFLLRTHSRKLVCTITVNELCYIVDNLRNYSNIYRRFAYEKGMSSSTLSTVSSRLIRRTTERLPELPPEPRQHLEKRKHFAPTTT